MTHSSIPRSPTSASTAGAALHPAPGSDWLWRVDQLESRLSSRPRADLSVSGFREAAILVPIHVEDGLPRVLLTRRPDAMRKHAGQIAFPGGARDDDDANAEATAVRETVEELGLPGDRIRVLGRLDGVPTPSGYNITPVVGRIDGPVSLSPSPDEVAEAFDVSLEALVAPGAYVCAGLHEYRGVSYEMHEYHVDGRRIWGATARILHHLLETLR